MKAILDFIRNKYVASAVRHLIGVLAGYLVATGALAEADAEVFAKIASGIVIFLLTQAWSWLDKRDSIKVKDAKAYVAALHAPNCGEEPTPE